MVWRVPSYDPTVPRSTASKGCLTLCCAVCSAVLCCVQCSAVLCCVVLWALLWCAASCAVLRAVLCCAVVQAVLCCRVLCCAVMCYAVLSCAMLSCAVLCCAVLCCAVLCCAVMCHAVLFSAVLPCAVLCCAVLCSFFLPVHVSLCAQVKEAKKYYPVLGFIANVAPILGGQYVRFASEISGGLPVNGMDPWEISLRWLLGGVVGAGVLLLGLYAYVQAYVMTDPNCVDPKRQRQSKQRTKLSIRESAVYLANSKYIRALAILVVAYGMSINIVEVTWKAKLKAQFPDPTSYRCTPGALGALSCFPFTTLIPLLPRAPFNNSAPHGGRGGGIPPPLK